MISGVLFLFCAESTDTECQEVGPQIHYEKVLPLVTYYTILYYTVHATRHTCSTCSMAWHGFWVSWLSTVALCRILLLHTHGCYFSLSLVVLSVCLFVCFVCSHFDVVTCVAFHPLDHVVVTGSEDCSLKLWNLQKAGQGRK